jgi:hypothetical protein
MIEILIVAALVLWSTVVVFKKVFPKTSNSVFLALAQACQRRGWQRLAKWLQPKMAAGCGGGCSCPSSEDKPAPTTVQEVKWK